MGSGTPAAARIPASCPAPVGRIGTDVAVVKRGVNADVDVRPIGDDLRQTAEFLQKRATSASPAQAEAFRREAAAVQPISRGLQVGPFACAYAASSTSGGFRPFSTCRTSRSLRRANQMSSSIAAA